MIRPGIFRHGGLDPPPLESGLSWSTLVLPMGVGSILGAFLGGILVPYVPAGALKIGLTLSGVGRKLTVR